MNNCYIVHGFNVDDGGKATTDRVISYVRGVGYNPVEIDYGNYDLIEVREENIDVVNILMDKVQHGDVFIGHSNGNAIIAEAIEHGAPFAKGVMIHPALKSFWVPPKLHPIERIAVFYHPTDYATWGAWLLRLFSPGNIIYGKHIWGAMGSTGPLAKDARMAGRLGAMGHSQGFKDIKKWGPRYVAELQSTEFSHTI